VAADVRGVAAVEFRLVSEGGSSRTVARDDSPDEGSAFGAGARYSATFQTASVPNGTYELEAIARDPTGNAGASGRRVLTVDNKGGGGGPGLQPGACANEVLGTVGADNLNGTPAGDRLLGGPGDDRLLGNGGADCLFGQDGADRMDGGAGDDQVDGAAGRDCSADPAATSCPEAPTATTSAAAAAPTASTAAPTATSSAEGATTTG
jgi:Ca2+-binding RTX toxin-like protein